MGKNKIAKNYENPVSQAHPLLSRQNISFISYI